MTDQEKQQKLHEALQNALAQQPAAEPSLTLAQQPHTEGLSEDVAAEPSLTQEDLCTWYKDAKPYIDDAVKIIRDLPVIPYNNLIAEAIELLEKAASAVCPA